MDDKGKNYIDPEGSRERKCCQQLLPYGMPTTYVEAVDDCPGGKCEKNVLPNEQKGCRKDSQGTKDQILIYKQILKQCKKDQRNLAMGWIDY